MPLQKNAGYIALHRSLRKKAYYQNANVVRVWIELLLLATYDRDEFEFNGETMILQPGQLVTGRKALARDLGLSEWCVERALTRLETEQQIAQQGGRRNRIITIKNWETYQNAHIKPHTYRTPSAHLAHTLNKVKKERKKEGNKGEGSVPSAPPAQVSLLPVIAAPSPREEATAFFAEPEKRQAVIDWMTGRGAAPEVATRELDKFISYWTEPTPNGKRQRWQTEKTFEIRRRLVTWLQRAGERSYSRQQAEPKGIRL